MTPLHFVVYGVAVPKGSMKANLPKGARYPHVIGDNPKTKSWQQLIAEGASVELNRHPWCAPLEAAMRVSIAFYLPRPKRLMRPTVPPPHLTKPDLDKLVRA